MPSWGQSALRVWWEENGSPRSGLVFPSRRGERAGEAKIKVSHARAFRRDLRRAWGIEAWDPKRAAFVAVREPTQRERTVLEGDAYTLPDDFHSWRRAYAQALADAGVTAQNVDAARGARDLFAARRLRPPVGARRHGP